MSLQRVVASNSIRLGNEFELDPDAYELRRAGQSLKLGRIPMELLLLLVEQRGQLVSREQIVEKIWGRGVFLDTDNSINAAIRKIRQTLEDDPDQPRFVLTVIGRGYRFIANVEEVACPPTLQSTTTERTPELPKEASEYRTLRAIAIFAVGAVVLLLVAGFENTSPGGVRTRLFQPAASAASTTSFHTRLSMAVIGFKNLSGRDEKAWISTALSELLSADLAAGQKLRLIPGEDVARMKVDLALPVADTYSGDTLSKVRTHLGSDMVVVGSYLAVGQRASERIRINVLVQDAKTGETLAAVSEDGREADLSKLVSQIGDNLRNILRVNGVTSNDVVSTRASLPANSKAVRFYAEALEKLRSFDAFSGSRSPASSDRR